MDKLIWTTEKRKLTELKNWDKNPRKIEKSKFRKLNESLDELGDFGVLVIDIDNTVISGNQRLQVLLAQNIEETDVKVPSRKLTQYEIDKIGLWANIPAGEWDMEKLETDFDKEMLQSLEFKLDFKPEEPEEDNYIIPDDLPVTAVSGQIYQLGNHRLICGDATKIEDITLLMDGKLADLVITYPPYNVDYTGKTKKALKIQNDKMSSSGFYDFLLAQYRSNFKFLKEGCPIYVFHADSEGHHFRQAMLDAGFKLTQTLIWVKNTIVMGRQDYHWQHEPILYGWKEGKSHRWYADRKQSTIIEYPKPNKNTKHPTMKPIGLIARLLGNSSQERDIVLDLFGGSGSTLIACEKTKRICYTSELDPKYCQVIIDRWEKLTGNKAKLL